MKIILRDEKELKDDSGFVNFSCTNSDLGVMELPDLKFKRVIISSAI